MVETKTTFCRICEALCGLEVDVEDGKVVDIRPGSSSTAFSIRRTGCSVR
jgi:anaerobic selenocysteine-containing dehydrogenase